MCLDEVDLTRSMMIIVSSILILDHTTTTTTITIAIAANNITITATATDAHLTLMRSMQLIVDRHEILAAIESRIRYGYWVGRGRGEWRRVDGLEFGLAVYRSICATTIQRVRIHARLFWCVLLLFTLKTQTSTKKL